MFSIAFLFVSCPQIGGPNLQVLLCIDGKRWPRPGYCCWQRPGLGKKAQRESKLKTPRHSHVMVEMSVGIVLHFSFMELVMAYLHPFWHSMPQRPLRLFTLRIDVLLFTFGDLWFVLIFWWMLWHLFFISGLASRATLYSFVWRYKLTCSNLMMTKRHLVQHCLYLKNISIWDLVVKDLSKVVAECLRRETQQFVSSRQSLKQSEASSRHSFTMASCWWSPLDLTEGSPRRVLRRTRRTELRSSWKMSSTPENFSEKMACCSWSQHQKAAKPCSDWEILWSSTTCYRLLFFFFSVVFFLNVLWKL